MAVESLGIDAIKGIRHPAGGGEQPAFGLVDKGFLTVDAARENFTLTEKGKDFLSYDPKPEFEETAVGGAVSVEAGE